MAIVICAVRQEHSLRYVMAKNMGGDHVLSSSIDIAQHTALKCGYADIDAVHSAFDGAYLAWVFALGGEGTSTRRGAQRDGHQRVSTPLVRISRFRLARRLSEN